MTTAQVLHEVKEERYRQDLRHGDQNHDVNKWLVILMEEVGEAAKDAYDGRLKHMRTELVQIAAVAVAIVESLDRNELNR